MSLNGNLTIGIDVGGTKVLGGVVDESGNILEKARRDTPRQGDRKSTRLNSSHT